MEIVRVQGVFLLCIILASLVLTVTFFFWKVSSTLSDIARTLKDISNKLDKSN